MQSWLFDTKHRRLVSHFFDRCPRAFRAEVAFLTQFNVLQLALSQWVTPYTIAFISGANSNKRNGSSGIDQANNTPTRQDMQQPHSSSDGSTNRSSSSIDSTGGSSGCSDSSNSSSSVTQSSQSGSDSSESIATTTIATSSDGTGTQVSSGMGSSSDAAASKAALGPGTRYEDEEDGGALAALMAKPLAFHSAEHQSSVALAQMLGVALQPMLRPLCVPVSSLGEMHRKLQALLATFRCG